jgi:NAD(P)-dependent dehydrogenase (short-subunit alcohol dehydrogenase family)
VQQFEFNVTGAYFTTIVCLRLLDNSNKYWEKASAAKDGEPKVKRTAQVITVTGIAAHAKVMQVCMGYTASKAGLLHLMRTMSTVLAPMGLRFVSLMRIAFRFLDLLTFSRICFLREVSFVPLIWQFYE